jgi:hypothetical protein
LNSLRGLPEIDLIQGPEQATGLREIAAIGSQVVTDFKHAHYSFKNEYLSSSL